MLRPIGPDKSWPSALIELAIMPKVDRLSFILKRVIPQEASKGRGFPSIETANQSIAWFADVLDESRLPPALDRVLRRVVSDFARLQGPLPPELVDGLWSETIGCLLRDLPPLPDTPEEYCSHIAALEERRWIGAHARNIPRGWLPIVERAVRVAETWLSPAEFERAATVYLGERFAHLDWVIGGHNPKLNGASEYVRTATGFACMGCGRLGEKDGGPAEGDRILTLCEDHRCLRRYDSQAFQRALYPEPEP